MMCYAFPLAHEAELLLKRCTEKESFVIDGLHCTLANFNRRRVLIAQIGMGEAIAADNMGTMFQHFRLKAVVLAGYGGALVPPLKVGQVVIANNYTSEAVLGFLRMLAGFDFASFCMVDEIVGTAAARDAVRQQTEAQVADMETEVVANVVSSRQIPFVAVRVISDEYAQVLPVGALAAGFDAAKARATPLKLLGYLLTHPGEIRPFVKFVQGLGMARRNLTRFLESLNSDLPASW
jgi:adenosylhomocysteine nucleosidase